MCKSYLCSCPLFSSLCFPYFQLRCCFLFPSEVHNCVSCLLAMLFSNAYKIMTGGIVGSCGSFPSLCCRDPRNSRCLPPNSAADPTLQANQPRGKVCSTNHVARFAAHLLQQGTATRNCCSKCKVFIVDMLWVDVSVFHIDDWIEWNSKLMLTSFLWIPSLVFCCQPTQSMLMLSLGTYWYEPMLGRHISIIAQVIFISLPVCWHCTYCCVVQGCCVCCSASWTEAAVALL